MSTYPCPQKHIITHRPKYVNITAGPSHTHESISRPPGEKSPCLPRCLHVCMDIAPQRDQTTHAQSPMLNGACCDVWYAAEDVAR